MKTNEATESLNFPVRSPQGPCCRVDGGGRDCFFSLCVRLPLLSMHGMEGSQLVSFVVGCIWQVACRRQLFMHLSSGSFQQHLCLLTRLSSDFVHGWDL